MFCNKSEAQNFSSIVDSCHDYLYTQDTMSFNPTSGFLILMEKSIMQDYIPLERNQKK